MMAIFILDILLILCLAWGLYQTGKNFPPGGPWGFA